MTDLRIPAGRRARPFLRALAGVLTVGDHRPTAVQVRVADALVARFAGEPLPSLAELEPAEPSEIAEFMDSADLRSNLADVAVLMELTEHPASAECERHLERYLGELGIDVPDVEIARDTARDHLVRLHADLLRNSWYTEQTVDSVGSGKLWEYARSKLAYYGVAGDKRISDRWLALGDCGEGTWGRGVFDFYRVHNFPFPGEPHGIYEIGALHDWVHVLTDYGTDPEGEIDVFAFIAQTMDDDRGFVQFIFTLALFQNASVKTVGGLKVAIATSDTLDQEGVPERLADSLSRGSVCTADVMGGVDHFALAEVPLEELRRRWRIPEKRRSSLGAFDVPDSP